MKTRKASKAKGKAALQAQQASTTSRASKATDAESKATDSESKATDTEKKKSKLPEQILGSKYIRSLEKVVGGFRDEAEAHGNRKLFLDDVFIVSLLAFFNPTVRSLRMIEDLSRSPNAQKHLSVKAVCKSTLSDFHKIADPSRLAPVIEALRAHIGDMCRSGRDQSKDLETLLKDVVAVDGTFLPAMADVLWAVANKNNHGATRYRARVDVRIDVHTWLPEMIVIPEAGQSESASAAQHIQANKIYVFDRAYSSYQLVRAHYEGAPNTDASDVDEPDADEPDVDEADTDESDIDSLLVKAHFVMRYKKEGPNSPTLVNKTERAITDQQRALGIVSDSTGFIRTKNARKAGIHKTRLREVVIAYQEKGEAKILRIITNLLDVSAETIALIYKSRWQIELFFRWLKTIANFNHLISHTREGTLAQLYISIIGVMVMYLHNAYRPSVYALALLGQVAMGAATLEDILPILQERERRSALDRASAARRRAKKQS